MALPGIKILSWPLNIRCMNPDIGYGMGRNNFPIVITIEYSTTGKAGGYMTDNAPESAHQPA